MDISRTFDGTSGGRSDQAINKVETQPDFSTMTLEQIQAWEAANALTPDGNIPAEAVESPAPHLSLVEEPAPQPVATEPSELLGYNSEAVQEQQTIASAFVQGEPFIHVVAYLTSGPVEIVASIDEALKLYESLASALTQAQQAGALS